ncbi:hypothetical protein ACFFSY_02730 [Paenibacillus aurantiacus]|uniref:Uncharacterized protein n=1 Tax=Paenibacillus aurantiacus TaxID=1936118 RepID=A0ABV5KI15_9BACL
MMAFDPKATLTTRNLLQFCYTCQEAHECDTERRCIACWQANGTWVEPANAERTTEELLVFYAL